MGAKNQDNVQFQETRNMETMGRFGYRNSLAHAGHIRGKRFSDSPLNLAGQPLLFG